jgi:prepilin peptidase CpaA
VAIDRFEAWSVGGRKMQPVVGLSVFGAATLVAIVAALTDLRSRKIPNLIPLSGCLLGLVLNLWADGWPGAEIAAAGFGTGILLMLPGYLLRVAGGGDLKLVAALGCLLGPWMLISAFVVAALVAGLWAVVQGSRAWINGDARLPFARYGQMLRFLLVTGRLTYYRPEEGEVAAMRVPFAPAMAIGTIVAPFLLS